MERLIPRPELLVGKSAEVARNTEQKVRELLGRHSDLMTPEVVDLIAQGEVVLALREYNERRLDGHENDDHSRQPGLTAYLTPYGRDRVVEMCKREGYAIAPTQIEKITPDLFALRLPRGVYNLVSGVMGGVQFFQEASPDWERSHKAEKPFSLGYNDVVRIEGDDNELWQNFNYYLDGTPKN